MKAIKDGMDTYTPASAKSSGADKKKGPQQRTLSFTPTPTGTPASQQSRTTGAETKSGKDKKRKPRPSCRPPDTPSTGGGPSGPPAKKQKQEMKQLAALKQQVKELTARLTAK